MHPHILQEISATYYHDNLTGLKYPTTFD
ncbi:hypothetical protein NMYAN_100055 [Nitrosomonas nitrosa]|uniref:Uncharacterized protein n=1 Tax=Nitrosomonas nitrosa TaxID=52442 RepID=A0A8H8YXK5_9PROT|nr:hypothetical protein NMYAN_100055 [Nitrosomonas nitrosa]